MPKRPRSGLFGLGGADHGSDLAERFDIHLAEPPVVVGADVDGEDVSVFAGSLIIREEFFGGVDQLVVFGQGVEPVRAAFTVREDGVGKFSHQVAIEVRFGVFVIAGGTGVADFSGAAAFAQVEAPGGLAVIEADE